MKKHKLLNVVGTFALREAMSIVGNVTKPAVEVLGHLIKNKLVYEVDLTKDFYFLEPMLIKAFPNLTNSVGWNMSESYNNDFEETRNLPYFTDCYDVKFYNGSPIYVAVTHVSLDKRQEKVLKFYTLKTEECVRNLNKFIRILNKLSFNEMKKNWGKSHFILTGDNRYYYEFKPRLRSFDDVFLPMEQKKEIITAVDKYRSRREWYVNNCIPNHFGILLYGVPSSGKTSIAQAIAKHMNAKLYVANGDDLSTLPEFIDANMQKESPAKELYRVLLVEDIDCGELSHSRTEECCHVSTNGSVERYSKCGLGTILNVFDGINAPSNIVYVFTTNHIEKLDPALIRPGRIDLKLEIGYICNETFNQFCKFHYGKIPETEIVLKDNLTFAQLQVMTMKGYSMEQLIEEVSVDRYVVESFEQ